MNIAVVGGGQRCRRLMEIIEQHAFQEVQPKIVAVADLDDQAPGICKAREMGLYVTRDYNDFFKLDDIQLIMELTGDMAIYNDILRKKKDDVRAIADKTVRLFWEIARVSFMQKKTDQELQETRAMYKALINQLIQEEVLVIAYDHRIIDVNDALLKKLGLERDAVIGRYCYEITHHQDIPCSGKLHPCPLIQTMETEKPSRTTHVHLDKNGKEIHYSIATYPMMEDGDVIGAIEVSRDITPEIQRQKAMMQHEKLVSIGRLSAGVAHEINNPLTTILTTAMLIQEDLDADDPNFQELEIIASETLRCRKIVTSLLNFARRTTPNKRENNLNEIIRGCITLTRKQAAFKDVALHHDLFAGVTPIFVDKGQIEQVMINLILNAVEATPPGGKITVTTQCSPDKLFAEIFITDTGVGIPEDAQARIFDPFFTTKENGTGLGLAIVHGIVEQHDGMVEVRSKVAEGTTFLIRLPYGRENGVHGS